MSTSRRFWFPLLFAFFFLFSCFLSTSETTESHEEETEIEVKQKASPEDLDEPQPTKTSSKTSLTSPKETEKLKSSGEKSKADKPAPQTTAAPPPTPPAPVPPPDFEQVRLSITQDSETEIVVSWLSHSLLKKPTVYYGLYHSDSILMHSAESVEKDPSLQLEKNLYIAKLTNLQPNSVYRYQVGDDVVGGVGQRSKVFVFRTFSQAKSEAVVGLFADMGTWGGAKQISYFLASQFSPDLVVHIGDICYGLTEEVWDTWGHMMEPTTSRVPYLVSPGNWDVRDNATKIFRYRFRSTQRHLFPHTTRLGADNISFYYSFNFSTIHFIVLSAYENYTKDSEQYKWAERELIAANQQRDIRPWIIALFHNPFYSSSTGHGGGDEKFRESFEELFHQHHVDAVVAGHDHGYERSYPVFKGVVEEKSKTGPYTNLKSLVHILAGVGGATGDPWQVQPDWSAYREDASGLLKIHAFKNDSIYFEFLRVNLTVADSFWLIKKKGFFDGGCIGCFLKDNLWYIFLFGFVIFIAYKYFKLSRPNATSSTNNTNKFVGSSMPTNEGGAAFGSSWFKTAPAAPTTPSSRFTTRVNSFV